VNKVVMDQSSTVFISVDLYGCMGGHIINLVNASSPSPLSACCAAYACHTNRCT